MATGDSDINMGSATDVASVIQAHHAWKRRIQSVINGTSDEVFDIELIAKDDLCVVGCWLYGAGKETMSHNQEYQNLLSKHKDVHLCAAHCLQLAYNGQKEEASKDLRQGNYSRALSEVMKALVALYKVKK